METEKADRRARALLSHLKEENTPSPTTLTPHQYPTAAQLDDDVAIVCTIRTPIGKAKRGSFKDTSVTDLLAAALKGVLDRSKIDPKLVQDIIVGNVLAPGGGAVQARQAMFLAGFDERTAVSTCNRQCSSGLQALAHVAAAIRNGYIDIGVAAGVESMSTGEMGAAQVGEVPSSVFDNEKATQCLISMGETSENVAERYGISRDKQDQMAFDSQKKALLAQKEGRFQAEIVPVTTKVIGADGQEKVVTVTQDEGPRATTLEGLKKLRAAFRPDGTTTAGNSSQVSDGAAAMLVMRRSVAKKLGMPVQLTLRSFAVVGVPPDVMGIGPAEAIPRALEKARLRVGDIDIYEINEAFASQATYSVEKLGIPMNKVNPNGGAIALGHPLGCTGARQVATLYSELKRTNKKYGVVSMCIGTGMGAAAVFEREN